MTRVACIVNPNARDGKLGRIFHKVEESLNSSGIDFDVFMTAGKAMQSRFPAICEAVTMI